jgi:hypothetical protein
MPILGDLAPTNLMLEVSHLARQNNTMDDYPPLVSAVQKMQWVKLACDTAILIDAELSRHTKEEFVPVGFIGQAQHAKSIFEIVAYGKATTDAVSLFLNKRWGLKQKRSRCDLKLQEFRDLAGRTSDELRDFLGEQKAWLDKDSRSTESLPAARDEWIHRTFPDTVTLWPPHAELGALPIPKTLGRPRDLTTPDQLRDLYWSTVEFAKLHWGSLARLVVLTLRAAVAAERVLSPDFKLSLEGARVGSFFKIYSPRGGTMKGYSISPVSTHLIGRQPSP